MLRDFLLSVLSDVPPESWAHQTIQSWMLPFGLGALCAGVIFAGRYNYYEGQLRKQLEELKKTK